MTRLRKGRLRWASAGGLVIALAVSAVVAWPYVRRYTGSAPPPQFYANVQLEPALARDYPRVLGVAHNAGNNRDDHRVRPPQAQEQDAEDHLNVTW